MRISDWSSDVCSSDLDAGLQLAGKIATLQCINPDSALFAWCRNASKDQPMSASSPHRIAAAPVKAVGKALAVVVLLVVAACAAEPRSEEHTSELQSLMRISYAVFCLKKKKKYIKSTHNTKVDNKTNQN